MASRTAPGSQAAARAEVERLVEGIRIDTVNVAGESTVVVTVNFKFSEQLGAESTMTVYGVGPSPVGVLSSSQCRMGR